MVKRCKKCGKEFPVQDWRRTICDECKSKKRIKICPVCGKEFKPDVPNKKYCSEECKRQKQREQHRNSYIKNREKIYERIKKRRIELREKRYPCYRFGDAYRIPTEMCLKCHKEECRFDNGN